MGTFFTLLGAVILIGTLAQWRKLPKWRKAFGVVIGLIVLVGGGSLDSPEPQSTPTQAPSAEPKKQAPTYDSVDIYTACTELVSRQLKAPRTAKFQPVWEATQIMGKDEKGNIIWVGWVDAQNAFGVYLRNRFVCTYNPKTNLVSVRFVQE
ncbi:hypothetical protein CSW50_02445 [Thermus scotoductus]|uniref:Uncharacterized protein n=1 Tax=Thermus scotoductus TaxID=37636 RepID=A0A430RAZ8_THESC|nr:hypothetical protein [Thermus scotoductus]RTH04555.1 hypothetical protein CSW50_02445 [Thermus scotoductus]RTI10972.1 hypothetical protein CSW30_03165 [Thermus scotoductus]